MQARRMEQVGAAAVRSHYARQIDMKPNEEPGVSPSAVTQGDQKRRQIAGRGLAIFIFSLLAAFICLYILITTVFVSSA